MQGQLKQSDALNYMLAHGNSKNMKRTFTFVNVATHQRFTYKITEMRGNSVKRFVKLMNGPDNSNNFVYFAHLSLVNNSFTYKHGGDKAKVSREAASVKFFELVIAHLRAKREMPGVEIWHSGKCAVCGRKLTVPESVANGIGPECAKRF